MAKLQVILNDTMVEEYRLTRGRVSIGRRRNSDIMLDSPVVSGDHALLERVGKTVYLEDRESTNGTRINGQKIKKRTALTLGDEIGVGRYVLRYCEDDTPAQPGFETTLMMTEVRPGGNQVDTRPVLEDPALEIVKAHQHIGVLKILEGSNAGKELDLTKSMTTLGKPGVQVVVISRRPEGYFLTKIEGNNHPKINGLEVGERPQPLADGDKVEIMGTSMVFALKLEVHTKAGV